MHSRSDLTIQYRTILMNIGWLCIASSFLFLTPLTALVFYPQEAHYALCFVQAGFISFTFGLVLYLLFRKGSWNKEITYQSGAVIVVSIWTLIIFFSALTFLFARLCNFTQAMFESASGWTTTGLTIMDVANTPQIFLFWRSIIQFVGGAGFAVIMLSSIAGGVSAGVYRAEGRSDNLLPNIKKTAKSILIIYCSYALFGFVALVATGTHPADAFHHTLTGLATGGFSNRAGNVGEIDRLSTEIILIALMLLGATSFGIHFLIWQRSFHTIRKNVEPKLFFFLLALFSVLIVVAITGIVYPNLPETIRHSVFQAVSAISGTGFQTTNFSGWPQSALFLLILLMCCGGMMDSTAGGVKQLRLYILFKAVAIEIVHFCLPVGSIRKYTIWKGNTRIDLDERLIKNTAVFFTLFGAHFLIGVSIFLFLGYDLTTACFELASALNNVGMSLGATNANASGVFLWNQIFAMFFGRLEFAVILFAISKVVRDGIQVVRA